METSEINFCNGKGFNIKNNREKSDILKDIYLNFEISLDDKYSSSYSDRLLRNLERYEYIISTITQGNKYWLYLTRICNENYSIFIDKKITEGHRFPKIIIVNIRFADTLYNNTLFEGELVKDFNNNWQFLINDILEYKNNQVKGILQKHIVAIHPKIYDVLYIYKEFDCLDNFPIKVI